MFVPFSSFFRRRYGRKPSLILMNGLAEQPETWFRNIETWRRYFDVHTPNFLAFGGDGLHDRIDRKLPINIEYLVDQLHDYLRRFAQSPPYHLCGSSTGAKVVVEFAVRYPELVDKLVLLGPSGLAENERMPIIEGVRRGDVRAMVESVFFNPRKGDRNLFSYYRVRVQDRRWRVGLLRTIRGTFEHSIRDKLPLVRHPTLMVIGQEDRIVEPAQAATGGPLLPRGQVVLLPRCGHAPHVEMPRIVNRLVVQFLRRGTRFPEGPSDGPSETLVSEVS